MHVATSNSDEDYCRDTCDVVDADCDFTNYTAYMYALGRPLAKAKLLSIIFIAVHVATSNSDEDNCRDTCDVVDVDCVFTNYTAYMYALGRPLAKAKLLSIIFIAVHVATSNSDEDNCRDTCDVVDADCDFTNYTAYMYALGRPLAKAKLLSIIFIAVHVATSNSDEDNCRDTCDVVDEDCDFTNYTAYMYALGRPLAKAKLL